MTEIARVRVWDLPTRLFHWLLTAAVVALVVSGNIGGNAMTWHFRFGYLVLGLLLFRLVWGFVGGRWARFSSFVRGPATTLRYLRGTAVQGEPVEVGHSPLGALSVLALLTVLALQVATGLVSFDDIEQVGGPLYALVSEATSLRALGWHTGAGKALVVGPVLLHVGAVLVYLLRRRNLIAPMWHGDKPLPDPALASADNRATRLRALVLAGACGAAVTWLVSLGG